MAARASKADVFRYVTRGLALSFVFYGLLDLFNLIDDLVPLTAALARLDHPIHTVEYYELRSITMAARVCCLVAAGVVCFNGGPMIRRFFGHEPAVEEHDDGVPTAFVASKKVAPVDE